MYVYVSINSDLRREVEEVGEVGEGGWGRRVGEGEEGEGRRDKRAERDMKVGAHATNTDPIPTIQLVHRVHCWALTGWVQVHIFNLSKGR